MHKQYNHTPVIAAGCGDLCAPFLITSGICDARPLTGSRLCPGLFGWANAATDSVSGRVWAETTSCHSCGDYLHVLPFTQMRCYAPSKAPLFRVRQDVVPLNLQSLSYIHNI
jgi:hypothetical protein